MPGQTNRGFDKSRADPPPPQIGLDEQSIELGLAVTVENHRETGDSVANFGDQDLAALDLLGGQRDCIRMGEQGLAVFVDAQRGASLEVFEPSAFVTAGGPDTQALHAP